MLLDLQELIEEHLKFCELDEDILLVSEDHLRLSVNIDLASGYSTTIYDFIEFGIERPQHCLLPYDLVDRGHVGLPDHDHLLANGLLDLLLVDQGLRDVVLEDVDLLQEGPDDLEIVSVLGQDDPPVSLVAELDDPYDVFLKD